MKQHNFWILSGIFSSAFLSASLAGFFEGEKQIQLEIDNGYRYDRVDETYEITDSAGIQPYASQEAMFKSLQSYQLGGKAAIEVCNWVVKGNAAYAWILSGDYNEDHVVTGNIDGYMLEGLIALGYDFCINDCFDVVPYFGYSYDAQHMRIKDFESFSPNFTVVTSHARKCVAWYGPWIGFDILFSGCVACKELAFNAGYEFHLGRARTHWHETDPGFGTFTTSTRMTDMYGHVFHLDTEYSPCDDWTLGIGLQYTYWGNSHKNKTSFGGTLDPGLTATQTERVFNLSWHSFVASLEVGYSF